MKQGRSPACVVLLNRVDELDRLSAWLELSWQELGLPEATLFELKLSVYEWVANVIAYAFTDDDSHRITVTLALCEQAAVATIEDDGFPFDPLLVPEPPEVTDLAAAAIGGRGVPLMRRLSDSLHYRRHEDRNHLTIVRCLNRGRA